MPAASGSWKRQGIDFPLQLPEVTSHADTVILTAQDSSWTLDLQSCRRTDLCCFKATMFVTAAIENYYTYVILTKARVKGETCI